MKKNILLGTIHILRKQFGVGGGLKIAIFTYVQYYVFLCLNKGEEGQKTAIFAYFQYYIYAYVWERVG